MVGIYKVIMVIMVSHGYLQVSIYMIIKVIMVIKIGIHKVIMVIKVSIYTKSKQVNSNFDIIHCLSINYIYILHDEHVHAACN